MLRDELQLEIKESLAKNLDPETRELIRQMSIKIESAYIMAEEIMADEDFGCIGKTIKDILNRP